MQEEVTSGEARLEHAEAALREALEDRARVWELAQQANALRHDLEYERAIVEQIKSSPSWRVTAPLRAAKNAVEPRARRARDLARKAQAHLRG